MQYLTFFCGFFRRVWREGIGLDVFVPRIVVLPLAHINRVFSSSSRKTVIGWFAEGQPLTATAGPASLALPLVAVVVVFTFFTIAAC